MKRQRTIPFILSAFALFSLLLSCTKFDIDGISDDWTISDFYNPPFDYDRDSLRILHIGNSYTVNMLQYLPDLTTNIGNPVSDIAVYYLYIGNSNFKTWVNTYKKNDPCTFKKVIGFVPISTSISSDQVCFRDILKDNHWDVILIQQASYEAKSFTRWGGIGQGDYLIELLSILNQTQPQATIGYVMPHAFKDDYKFNTERSSFEMWQKIADATKELMTNYGINLIVPYGTAVENLRSSSINVDDFSVDGTHLAAGLGLYVSACCYYEQILGKRFGTSMYGNSLRFPSSTFPVTDENAELAQKAALAAINNMFTNTNPEYFSLKR